MQDLAPIPYKIIAKFHNEIRTYFEQLYGLPEVVFFDNTNIKDYQDKVDNILYEVDEFKKASFISPDGKLKRVCLNWSNFNIKELYKDLLNLNLDKLKNEYTMEHNVVKYFGLDINNILLAGYLRIGWNKYKNQFYIQFDNKYCFPGFAVLKIIENILIEMDEVYIALGNNEDYAIFSIKKGDTIKDIKYYFNQHKK